jgi:hypothetical protein
VNRIIVSGIRPFIRRESPFYVPDNLLNQTANCRSRLTVLADLCRSSRLIESSLIRWKMDCLRLSLFKCFRLYELLITLSQIISLPAISNASGLKPHDVIPFANVKSFKIKNTCWGEFHGFDERALHVKERNRDAFFRLELR